MLCCLLLPEAARAMRLCRCRALHDFRAACFFSLSQRRRRRHAMRHALIMPLRRAASRCYDTITQQPRSRYALPRCHADILRR